MEVDPRIVVCLYRTFELFEVQRFHAWGQLILLIVVLGGHLRPGRWHLDILHRDWRQLRRLRAVYVRFARRVPRTAEDYIRCRLVARRAADATTGGAPITPLSQLLLSDVVASLLAPV